MRAIPSIVLSLCASAAVGCPGTLDDSEFNAYGYGGSGAPGQLVPEGGAASRDGAVAWDAGGKWTPGDDAAGPQSWTDAGTRPGWVDAAATPNAPADAGDTSSTPPACDFRALMQARCGNASCHGGPESSTGLDLTSAGLAERVKGQQASGACGQYLMIDTQAPDQSALYLKVTESACGVRMPIGASLNSAEQACILQWIERL